MTWWYNAAAFPMFVDSHSRSWHEEIQIELATLLKCIIFFGLNDDITLTIAFVFFYFSHSVSSLLWRTLSLIIRVDLSQNLSVSWSWMYHELGRCHARIRTSHYNTGLSTGFACHCQMRNHTPNWTLHKECDKLYTSMFSSPGNSDLS